MEVTKVQLNASLRFSPSGELISRDLLLNFREQSVDEVVQLLGDFTRKFNINLGLPERTVETRPQPEAPTATLPTGTPTNCPRCMAPLIRRKVGNKNSASYGKEFLGCGNYTKRGCLFTHWL
jgi:ssDNA-binding Zn-finger/Zn-ribbon topoisomerase 1